MQLLALRGAHVLGIASPANDTWLDVHHATPIHYGDNLAARLAAAAPDGIDAFIDLYGPEYVQLVADLGIRRDRIETTIAFDKAHELGTKAQGSADASNRDVLTEIADLVAGGQIQIPIAATLRLPKTPSTQFRLHVVRTSGNDLVCAVAVATVLRGAYLASPTGRAGMASGHDGEVLLRLAYLTVTNTFAVLRLLPMSDRDKDAEILALRHQITVLQRHLDPGTVTLTPADRAFLAALLQPLPRP